MKNYLTLIILLSSLVSCQKMDIISPAVEMQIFQNIEEGYTVSSEGIWNVDLDGVLVGTGGQSYLALDQQYSDFILEAEFYPDEVINSGIFIRCPGKDGSAVDCYEINISDDHDNQEYRTGSIVTHGPPLARVNSVGKWNHYKIKAKGNRIEVWLNNVKTADVTDGKAKNGHIVLQVFDKGEIRFKNLVIQEL